MEDRFLTYTELIVSHYEGGYYHPDMYRSDPAFFALYSNSGETMYGIDRTAGGAINTSPQGQAFWAEIDALDARHRWPWNFKPPKGSSLDRKLKRLCTEMMYNVYEKYALKNLSDKARRLVSKNPRLEAHLFYGCWNGIGYLTGFSGVKGFVPIINDAVSGGITRADKLEEVALNSRRQHPYAFMRERAKNLEAMWKELDSRSRRWMWILGGGVLIAAAAWWATRRPGTLSGEFKTPEPRYYNVFEPSDIPEGEIPDKPHRNVSFDDGGKAETGPLKDWYRPEGMTPHFEPTRPPRTFGQGVAERLSDARTTINKYFRYHRPESWRITEEDKTEILEQSAKLVKDLRRLTNKW